MMQLSQQSIATSSNKERSKRGDQFVPWPGPSRPLPGPLKRDVSRVVVEGRNVVKKKSQSQSQVSFCKDKSEADELL
jgi:hypothetical protein